MENQSNISCPDSEAISEAPYFTTLLILESITSILSVPPNLVLAYVIFRAIIYPSNLRILLSHLSLSLVCCGISNSIKLLDMVSRRGCDLATTAYKCRLTDLSITIPNGNIFYTLMGICLERLYCSIRYRTYEKESSKPWLALTFLSIIWTGSLAANLIPLSLIPRNRWVPICETILSIGSSDAINSLISSVILELIALFMILCVHWWDYRKFSHSAVNRAKFTLAERFQINQCVQVNKMIVPSVILHGVCFLPYLILLILVACGISMSIELKWALLHLASGYRMVYALFHPILAFGRNARLRQYLIKHIDFRGQKRDGYPTTTGAQSNINAHFNILDSFWAAPSGRRVKANAV